jgi:hypothetical protein
MWGLRWQIGVISPGITELRTLIDLAVFNTEYSPEACSQWQSSPNTSKRRSRPPTWGIAEYAPHLGCKWYLDAETAEIDGLVAEKGQMLALLEEKRAALVIHHGKPSLESASTYRST